MKAAAAAVLVALLAGSALAQSPPPPPLPTLGPSSAPSQGPSQSSPPQQAPPTPPSPAPARPPTQPPTSTPPSPAPTTPPPAPAPGSSPPPATPPPAPAPRSSPPPPGPASPPPPASPPSSGATPAPTTAAAATSSSPSGGSSSGPTDADVLTFAYNLECLEGQFYSCAAFGTPLDTSITGNGPAPSSCKKASLTSNVATYAAELAREETAHVRLLYTALTAAGARPVCPAVNIDTAFETAAEAAFNQAGTPLNPLFDPYANDVFFLHAAFIFEDLGASAYLAGQGLLQNATLRQVAGQIGNAESYHSGIVRTLLYQILTTTPAYGKTVGEITSAITAAVNSLAGSPQIRYTLSNDQGSQISNVDSSGLVPVATPAQVLKVATLGASAGNGGGFFPQNLVGNVRN